MPAAPYVDAIKDLNSLIAKTEKIQEIHANLFAVSADYQPDSTSGSMGGLWLTGVLTAA